jgi:predicted MFS family arabinose efflux permease
VLIAASPRLLFFAAAAALVVFAVPTVRLLLRRAERNDPDGDNDDHGRAGLGDLLAVVRLPGAREVIVAQGLWVLAYVALPTFFVLYAREVLGLGTTTASFVLGGVSVVAGAGMLAGGRLPPRLVRPALLAGAALLGAGLTVGAAFDEVLAVLPPFAAAAFGFGLVNALGFPYFSRFIPDDAPGRFSGMYFAVRAVAAAIALPLAGLMIELTGGYRGILLQGAAAFVALLPLARARRQEPEGER